MKNYLYDYIKEIDELINNGNINDIEELKKEHLVKIQFFQHERMIHLIVTLFYFIFMLIFLAIASIFWLFLVIGFILLIFVIFYIIHYFRLENGVQYLYVQYDKLNELSKQPETFWSMLASKFIDHLIDRI